MTDDIAKLPSALIDLPPNLIQKSPNIDALSYDEVTELLQHALQQYPSFVPIVSEAIARANARKRGLVPKVETIPTAPTVAPRPINYQRAASEFRRILHSLDNLGVVGRSKFTRTLDRELQETISKVSGSVNVVSPSHTVKEAYDCLCKLADHVWDTLEDMKIHFTNDIGCVMQVVCQELVNVGSILKDKGGISLADIKETALRNAGGSLDEFPWSEDTFPWEFECSWGGDGSDVGWIGDHSDASGEMDSNEGEEESDDEGEYPSKKRIRT